MPPRIAHPPLNNAVGRKRRSKRKTPPVLGSLAKLAFLASCLLHHSSIIIPLVRPSNVRAEPHSTIPRSNNRYTRYGSEGGGSVDTSSSSGIDTLSSPLGNRESYQPPWNPSPKIDPHGFLSELYPRTPGEWESLANIRGRHGPRNRARHARILDVPVAIRQVPGDGNCLFHSISACLHHAANGTHLPMDSHSSIMSLRSRSLALRNAAVDALLDARDKGTRRLFLQGEEYLEARELLHAAAAQFDLAGEEYCELMRKESYWGGGPEIVALCNYLQRPIHIYELIPAEEASSAQNAISPTTDKDNPCAADDDTKTSNQFTLRRMACFGSPKFDRREPLHILSADSRFPDVEPRRIRKVGNHFLALFPANRLGEVNGERAGPGGSIKFRRHALLRGGSRQSQHEDRDVRGRSQRRSDRNRDDGVDNGGEANGKVGKWDGGWGSWTNDAMNYGV